MGNLAQHAGQRIRTFRKLRGMSAQQLAQRIGKSKATVYKYESGEIPPDVDTLADISRELDVEPAHLLDVPFQKRDVTPKLSFFDANRLYAYYYDGRTRQMTHSLLTFCPSADGEPWEAFLYMISTTRSAPAICIPALWPLMRSPLTLLFVILPCPSKLWLSSFCIPSVQDSAPGGCFWGCPTSR